MGLGSHSRIGLRWSMLRWACAGVLVAAIAAMPPGVATGVQGPQRGAWSAHLRSGLSLAHAPAGLRAAVKRTPGARVGAMAWSQQQKLTASDAAAGDQFGTAVAISGSTAVVGAAFKNSRTGAAYVFAGG